MSPDDCLHGDVQACWWEQRCSQVYTEAGHQVHGDVHLHVVETAMSPDDRLYRTGLVMPVLCSM
jgi:hypothetical protein